MEKSYSCARAHQAGRKEQFCINCQRRQQPHGWSVSPCCLTGFVVTAPAVILFQILRSSSDSGKAQRIRGLRRWQDETRGQPATVFAYHNGASLNSGIESTGSPAGRQCLPGRSMPVAQYGTADRAKSGVPFSVRWANSSVAVADSLVAPLDFNIHSQ